MALTGIEIYKKLPRTNCGDCGVPTCMAFAMKLAAGQAELSQCPHVSEEAKAMLSEASAPPIRPVTIGTGKLATKIGAETVLFRHEKTFVNPPGLGVLITDAMSDADVDAKIERLNQLTFERVGLILRANLAVLKATKGDAAAFEALAKKVADKTECGIVLIADDPVVLGPAAKAIEDKKPLIGPATADNADKVAALAKGKNLPVIAKADGIEKIIEVIKKLQAAGIKDIVLDTGARKIKKALEDQVIIRRLGIVAKNRDAGFPTIVFPCEMTDSFLKESLYASLFIAKYSGVIVLSDVRGENLFPLTVARMNIYTDPQRPMATTPGIYELNNPKENSPVLITSNFSLTYFIISGEVEGSRMPAWLLVLDTEGLSVLTTWAAGKFVADAIGPFVKKSGILEKVKNLRLVIPGAVASISGELEEELPDWKILIGPREAAYVTPFLKQLQ
jgi:acetyl-CoA decarbonylase/synthase, CODH/ACS complex subunit gamma